MSGPYRPGDIIPFAVTAAENISGIVVSKFTKWTSAGVATDGTASITLNVTGTGTQECHCKYTVPSGYAAGDTIALTIILTLASSGAQSPQLAHDSIVLVQWSATALPVPSAGAAGGIGDLTRYAGNPISGSVLSGVPLVSVGYYEDVSLGQIYTLNIATDTAINFLDSNSAVVLSLPDASQVESATDPLANAVPGSYAAGTAGKAISDIRKVVQARGG